MRTIDYLVRARDMTATKSDYALGKALKMSQPAVSNYMSGKRIIDDTAALKLAEFLGVDAGPIIAQANYERAAGDDKLLWKNYLEKLGGVAAALFFSVNLVLTPSPAEAAPVLERVSYVCILCKIVRRWMGRQLVKVAGLYGLRNCQGSVSYKSIRCIA